jgi:hypothetical protein
MILPGTGGRSASVLNHVATKTVPAIPDTSAIEMSESSGRIYRAMSRIAVCTTRPGTIGITTRR